MQKQVVSDHMRARGLLSFAEGSRREEREEEGGGERRVVDERRER